MKQKLMLLVAMGLLVGVLSAPTMAAPTVLIGGALNNGYLDEAVAVQNTTGANPLSFIPQPAVWTYEGNTALAGPFVDGLTVEAFANGSNTPQTTGSLGGPPRPDGCSNNAATADCGAFFKSFAGTVTATPPATPRGPITVHLYQDHPATPGLTYDLTGWAGAGGGHVAVGHQLAIDFLDSNGDVIPLSGSFNPMAELFVDNGQPFDYKEYMTSAVAPANAVEIRARLSMLEGTANPLGGDQAFVMDDITLICIPEPASVSIGLIGVVGLLGLIRRR